MFHVEKICPELREVLNYAPLTLKDNLTYEEQTVHIVDRTHKKFNEKTISKEGARHKYSLLFES